MDAALDLTIRPVRPADKERVSEMVREIWDGHDYLPQRFDDWVGDPAASFQAFELDGTVVGVHRLRPIASGLIFYEGMRVDPALQRQGIGSAMLEAAIEEAGAAGFHEMRLVSANPHAIRLFGRRGFERRAWLTSWLAGRVEGGDPARVADPADAGRLAAGVKDDPAYAAYGGVSSYWSAPLDIDEALLRQLASEGLIRVNGRALAGLSPTRTDRLGVNFVFGSGAALQDLLMALRFEADIDGMDGVWLAAPPDHPATGDLQAVGYDFSDDLRFGVFSLRLDR